MSKVGRAARIASKMRVETLTGTKTIAPAKTGELYLVAAAASVVLPSAADGAYFKFVFSANVTSATALVLTTASTDESWIGTVLCVDENADSNAGEFDFHATQEDRAVTGDNHEVLTIGSVGNIILAGSWVEVVSNGTDWVATGLVRCDAADSSAVFSG